MLDVDILPHIGLKNRLFEFTLGMSLNETLAIIRTYDDMIRNVKLRYSKENTEDNIEIHLEREGIRLFFDNISQILTVILLEKLHIFNFYYWNKCFRSQEIPPTLSVITKIFGEKVIKDDLSTTQNLDLDYNGIQFRFSRVKSTVTEDSFIYDQFKADSIKIFTKVVVRSINSYGGNIFPEKVEVILNETTSQLIGLSIDFSYVGRGFNGKLEIKTKKNVNLFLADDMNDVISLLGAPNKTHYKNEDKSRIELPKRNHFVQFQEPGQFLNYSTLGIDFFIHTNSNKVRKIILHNNHIEDYYFGAYTRCPYIIRLSEKLNINPMTKWTDLMKSLDMTEEQVKPAIINRDVEHRRIGKTYAFNFKNIIFEVLPNCDYISSMTIFSVQ